MTGLQAALEGIERFVAERLPRSDAPGVVVALTDRERLLGAVAVGNGRRRRRAAGGLDDRFQIGSISKSFAAIIAMQEVESGRLDLRAPVTGYVPWFAVGSRFGPITPHHLLTHTAGLIMGTDFGLDGVHQVWALRETECAYAPGERSPTPTTATSCSASCSRRPPAGPSRSCWWNVYWGRWAWRTATRRSRWRRGRRSLSRISAPSPIGRATQGSPGRSAPGTRRRPPTAASSRRPPTCAPTRVCCLPAATRRRDACSREDSWERLTQRAVEDPDESGAWYGYGLMTRERDGRTLIGHSGSMVGYSSYLMTDPEAKLAVVVLMNGIEDRVELVHYALKAGRAELAGDPYPPPPPVDPTVGDDAGDFAGTYRLCGGPGGGPGGELTLAASCGRLLLRAAGVEVALERRAPDVFVAPHPDWDRYYLRAGRDAAGAVT